MDPTHLLLFNNIENFGMERHNSDFNDLQDSLYYLHVGELKDYCNQLDLSVKGKKVFLINRIMHFIKTGKKIDLPKYPSNSIFKGKNFLPPSKEGLMLKGSYKNDLKTRLFFKGIIGQHFHFTAFGIDWLESAWMNGKPPTYQEFADMWVKEYEFRKTHGSTPKEEWAYINFVKQYLVDYPGATRNKILESWQIKRQNHKNLVDSFLKSYNHL